MHDQPAFVDPRVRELEQSVDRLTSEVTSLNLEVATLVGALREAQAFSGARRLAAPPKPTKVEPPSRPSPLPATVVVLLASLLLSWQVILGPRREGAERPVVNPISQSARAANPRHAQSAPIDQPLTEPPVTPLVTPTVYKGTLTVNADRPGARVFVNRREIGTAPIRLRNLKAGAHLVWIERDGYRRWTRVVTVPAERVTRVAADLEPLEPVVEP